MLYYISTTGGSIELQCVIRCVWGIGIVELSLVAAAGSTVALIMQVLQVLGEKEDFSFSGLNGSEERGCSGKAES